MIKKKLSEKEKYNIGVALEMAIKKLSAADPRQVSMKSGVIFNREQESYIVPYLNRKYLVNHSTGNITPLQQNDKGVSIQQQTLFLHYLATAGGDSLQNEWITFKELPGGAIYTGPYQNRTIKPFLKYFGEQPRRFQKIAASLGGISAAFGDLCMILRPFPRVPIGFVLWEGDEEFPPSANILYDASASSYLPTEDYALLPGLIIWEMAALL